MHIYCILHTISLQSCPLFVPQWTVACQVSLSMRFSRQECWSGLPFPSPEDVPYPGIELAFFTSPALAGGFFTTSVTWEGTYYILTSIIFPVVMYGCMSWTTKKAVCQRIDVFELW